MKLKRLKDSHQGQHAWKDSVMQVGVITIIHKSQTVQTTIISIQDVDMNITRVVLCFL